MNCLETFSIMNTYLKYTALALITLIFTSFQMMAQNPSIMVTVDLDSYESETSWTLTGPNGFSKSGGTYADNKDVINETYATTSFGNYTFTINDSYGDGLSDNSGGSNSNGIAYYKISVGGNPVFISTNMPDFGYSAEVKFDILDSDGDGVSDAFDEDDDNDGIKDLDENTCQTDQFVNGDFEDVLESVSTYKIMDASQVPGWETTSPDNKIEIWNSGFNGFAAYSGNKFAEIDANQRAKMYQTLDVLPGDVVTWKVAHRGRSGVDVMHIMVGPTGSPVNQQTASTGTLAWVVYTNTYTVPTGIFQIEMGFEAVSSVGGTSYGNFIDDVELYIISTDACDVDNDGIPNYLDIDSDNDGIMDVVEAGGVDPDNDGQIGIGAITDTDGDGLSDLVDTDNGGTILANADSDGDGLHNIHDIDSDNDGIVDMIESQPTISYETPSGVDTDGDGLDDKFDEDNGGTYIHPLDSDYDGIPDYLDLDSDDDGESDYLEVFDTNSDGYADVNPTYLDNDGDGLDNAFDADGTSTINNGTADNNDQVPGALPNNDGGDAEPDWREPSDGDDANLPIELLSFQATEFDKAVELLWVTATEIDNDYFSIERSTDGARFETVITIDGGGNSIEVLNYTFIDDQPFEGVSYYRLKQTDYNGEFTYSDIETVNFDGKEMLEISRARPNPFTNQLAIDFQSGSDEIIRVQVYNMQSQVIYITDFEANEGLNSVLIDANEIPAAGVYYVVLTSNNQNSKPIRVVKQ